MTIRIINHSVCKSWETNIYMNVWKSVIIITASFILHFGLSVERDCTPGCDGDVTGCESVKYTTGTL